MLTGVMRTCPVCWIVNIHSVRHSREVHCVRCKHIWTVRLSRFEKDLYVTLGNYRVIK